MAASPPDDRDGAHPPGSASRPQSSEATESFAPRELPEADRARGEATQAERPPPQARPSPLPRRPDPGPSGASQERRELTRGERIDRYVILKSVGQGAMGLVYAAYDPELDRKVALKLLRPDGSEEDLTGGRARLLREAQAMARVSHPNVCSVFDVGTIGDQIFMAMELVEGPNLHRWLKEPGRSWRSILRVFIEAGRGLAAAHEAGLVHRDFKPANVLIGKDERVYVTDFGLARLVASSDGEPSVMIERLPRRRRAPAISESVTEVGVVVGTPNYMPPEQYLGRVPDARSDQFSFCAALYWALYKKYPFEPDRVADAADELSQDPTSMLGAGGQPRAPGGPTRSGIIQEPPAGSKVPGWVRRAVLRGLSLRPSERFPSMKELLEELSQEPRRVRRQWTAAAAGLVLVASAGAFVQVQRRGQVCAGADRLMAQAWNPEVKRKLEAAFGATGKPFAKEAAQSVGQVLDGYARDWARQHTEACEATRVRGVQTEELLSLRVVCLERQRKDFQALARLFTEADGRLVVRAVDAVHALPALQECQDIESLSNQVGLPADPARRAQIEQLGAKLSEMRALGRAGRYEDALKSAGELEPKVVATGYLPLQAELRSSMGWYQQLRGDAEGAARKIEQALNDAEAGRADRRKVEALIELVFIRGIQGRPEQAEQWARLAESALRRIGGDPLLSSELMGNLGNVALRQGRYQEARGHLEKTRELQEKVLALDDPRRMRTTYNLGVAALLIGESSRAKKLLGEALRQMEAALGSQHPEVALCHSMLSWAFRESGGFDQALEHARKAVAIRKAVFGEGHPAVADALDAVGMSLIKLGRHEEARETFETAVAMKAKALGPESLELSYSYDGVGQALLAAGRAREAIAPLEKALAFKDVEPESLAESGFALARALWQEGRDRARALAEATRARERFAQVDKQERVAEVEAWLKAR